MPRRSNASDNSGAAGSGPEFRGAEQSLNLMKQVNSYFSVGMDHVFEVATDMVEYGMIKGDNGDAEKLKKMMLSYADMERQAKDFMGASRTVIDGANEDEEEWELKKKLDNHLKRISKGHSKHSLKQHEKYLELEQKFSERQNAEEEGSLMAASGRVPADGDVEMTQEHVNTKCPYTGKEMQDPVRNIHCKHVYDNQGILQYIKHRGRKAMCPVGGCKNTNPLVAKDLEENKEMKRYIQGRKKHSAQT